MPRRGSSARLDLGRRRVPGERGRRGAREQAGSSRRDRSATWPRSVVVEGHEPIGVVPISSPPAPASPDAGRCPVDLVRDGAGDGFHFSSAEPLFAVTTEVSLETKDSATAGVHAGDDVVVRPGRERPDDRQRQRARLELGRRDREEVGERERAAGRVDHELLRGVRVRQVEPGQRGRGQQGRVGSGRAGVVDVDHVLLAVAAAQEVTGR